MTATLDWVVDNRGTAGPIIDQGERPTCLSCAISAAHHHAVGVAKSIEYLHYGSRKQPAGAGSVSSARSVLDQEGQPDESAWPYDPLVDEDVISPLPPNPLAGPFHRADLQVEPDAQPDDLVRRLEDGHLPVIGLLTTPGFMRLSSGVLTEPGPHIGRHAVLVVGIARYRGPDVGVLQPDDYLMCMQNSWGTAWGAGGLGLIGPRAWSDMVLVSAHVVPT
jgi:hypothetical protein